MKSGSAGFAGTVNGAHNLTVNSAGATTFSSVVGDTAALTSLTTDADGTSSSVGVQTTGATTFNDNTTLSGTYGSSAFTAGGTTTLAGDTTITAANATFNSTIDGTTAGGQSLTVNASGTTTLGDNIGVNQELNKITILSGFIDVTKAPGIIAKSTGIQQYHLPAKTYFTTANFLLAKDANGIELYSDQGQIELDDLLKGLFRNMQKPQTTEATLTGEATTETPDLPPGARLKRSGQVKPPKKLVK